MSQVLKNLLTQGFCSVTIWDIIKQIQRQQLLILGNSEERHRRDHLTGTRFLPFGEDGEGHSRKREQHVQRCGGKRVNDSQ